MSQRKKIPTNKDVKTEKSKEDETKVFLPERIYVDRDSLFTEMFKINHFSSLLNMFLSFIVLMLMNTILNDWLQQGFLQHFHHISWVKDAFAEPHMVILTLLVLYSLSMLIFPLIKFWISLKRRWKNVDKLIDIVSFLIYLLIIGCIVVFPIWVVMNYDIPPCSSNFIVYEQIRIFMKIHAYVRSVVPRLQNTIENEEQTSSILSLSKYLYFWIVPTLIYRDSYPKRKVINYNYAISCFLQFILCIIFIYYIFINLIRPMFIDFQPEFMTKEVIIPKLFQAILPTILLLLTMFFSFLHLWSNMFAELTKFGDRQFYKDWWNSTSLSDYLRTWNVLIHDWLYTYLYVDVSYMMFKLTNHKKISKSFGMITVLLFSALVHEYVLAFCFRFFYPVLLTFYFCSGTILYFLKANRTSRISNVMVWTSLFIGNTIFLTLYSLEWYARKNCVRKFDGYLDFVVPRSFSCEMLKNASTLI